MLFSLELGFSECEDTERQICQKTCLTNFYCFIPKNQVRVTIFFQKKPKKNTRLQQAAVIQCLAAKPGLKFFKVCNVIKFLNLKKGGRTPENLL
jgi:hypothetical protein